MDTPVLWHAAHDLAPLFAVVFSLSAVLVSLGCLFMVWTALRSRPAPHPPAKDGTWSDAYFDGMLRWADRACRELSLAIHLAESRNEADRDRKLGEIRASLSHLIDTGYWFLPNSSSDRPEPDLPPAYRGVRHPALDLLVAARGLVGQSDPIGIAALVRAKREFVSHLQALLNPRQRERGIADVLDRFASVRDGQAGPLG